MLILHLSGVCLVLCAYQLCSVRLWCVSVFCDVVKSNKGELVLRQYDVFWIVGPLLMVLVPLGT